MENEVDIKSVIDDIHKRQQAAIDDLLSIIKDQHNNNITLLEKVTRLTQENNKTQLDMIALLLKKQA